MSTTFLSIRDAARQYEVSEMTVRRLIRGIVNEPGHKDRELIRPNAEDLAKLKASRTSFEYEISSDLLKLNYLPRNRSGGEASGIAGDIQADIGSAAIKVLEDSNQLLREQLSVKDEQIGKLMGMIEQLTEGQKMTNVLLGQLHQRLPMPKSEQIVDTNSDEKRGVFTRFFRAKTATK